MIEPAAAEPTSKTDQNHKPYFSTEGPFARLCSAAERAHIMFKRGTRSKTNLKEEMRKSDIVDDSSEEFIVPEEDSILSQPEVNAHATDPEGQRRGFWSFYPLFFSFFCFFSFFLCSCLSSPRSSCRWWTCRTAVDRRVSAARPGPTTRIARLEPAFKPTLCSKARLASFLCGPRWRTLCNAIAGSSLWSFVLSSRVLLTRFFFFPSLCRGGSRGWTLSPSLNSCSGGT